MTNFYLYIDVEMRPCANFH